MKIIAVIILCWCFYVIGREDGNEETTRLVKQYWEEAKDVNDFFFKFTTLWFKNIKEDKKRR